MADDKPIKPTDGDTFNDPERGPIRVRGVDTPEFTSFSSPGTGGWQAKEFTRNFLRDGHSLGEKTGETYGREVRDVYDNEGRRLSDSLIRHDLGGRTGWSDSQETTALATGIADDLFDREGDPETEALKRTAREHRARNLERFLRGEFDDRVAAGNLKYLGDKEGWGSRAFDRGFAELKASGYAAMDAVGDIIGAERMEELGEDGVRQAMLDAARNPAEVAEWEDADDLGDIGVGIMERLIAEAPSVGVDLGIATVSGGGSLVASGVGKAFLRRVGGAQATSLAKPISREIFKRGAKTGAFGSMYAQNVGESHLQQLSVDEDRPGRALLIGGGKTALDYGSFMGILGDVGKRLKGGESIDSIGKWFGSTLESVGTNFGREGITEMTQSLIDELNKVELTDGEYQVDTGELFEALTTGGIVGGTFGGAGAGLGGALELLRSGDRGTGERPPEEEPRDPEVPTGERPRRRRWDDRVDTAEPAAEPTAKEQPTRAEPAAEEQPTRTEPAAEEQPTRTEPAAEEQPTPRDTRQPVDPPRDTRQDPASQAERTGPTAQERRAAIDEQMEVLKGTRPAPREQLTAGVEDQERPAPFRFTEERMPADARPVIEEAAELGIDPAPYQRTEPSVDEQVLRRELTSMLGEALPDSPNTTLRESLGGRDLSSLDASQLRQLARAMGLRKLPQRFKRVEGDREAFRNIAKAAVAKKLGEWRQGTKSTSDGKWLEARSPSDMNLLAGLVPELEGLRRSNFGRGADGTAQYQTAVRQALNKAFPNQASLRQHLASLSDEQLWQAGQLTRADVPTGGAQGQRQYTVELDEQPVVDTGGLSRAVAERRMPGEGGSRDTRSEVTSQRVEALQSVDDPFDEDVDTPTVEEQQAQEQRLRDASRVAGVGAAYRELTGQTEGPGLASVMASQQGSLADDELRQIQPKAIDGRRLVGAVASRARNEQAARKEWEQLALTSPTQFAQELTAAIDQMGLDPAEYLADTAASDDYNADSRPRSGREAQGTQSRGFVGSSEPAAPTGMNYSQLAGGRTEQEASDGLFFIGQLDGARFGTDSDGNTVPAGPVQPGSGSPMHEQRVESEERRQRLDDRNLASLTIRNREGVEEPWLFDLVALARYGQPGEGRVESAEDAYRNLMANFSRMFNGPQTAMHLPGGPSASYVQSLSTDVLFGIDHRTVIYEDGNGKAVTLGEAERAYYSQLRSQQDATALADEADAMREVQRNRREAMRILLSRALNSLDGLEGDQRLARVKAINDVLYQAEEGDRLVETVMTSEALAPSEVAYIQGQAAKRVDTLRKRIETTERSMAVAGNILEDSKNEVASVARDPLSNDYQRDNARFAVIAAEERVNRVERDLRSFRQRLTAAEQLSTTAEVQEASSEAPDLRDVRTGDLSRFRLTDAEMARVGDTGGHENLETLRTAYRRTRDELRVITDTLIHHERTTAQNDPQLDSLAREYMLEGMGYDEAYDVAEQMVDRASGVSGQESNTEVLGLGDADSPLTDPDGNPIDAYVDAEGNAAVAPVTRSPNDPDNETSSVDESAMDAAQREAFRRGNQQRDEAHTKAVEAFLEANPERRAADVQTRPNPSPYQAILGPVNVAPGAANRLRGRSVYREGRLDDAVATPAHGEARRRMEAAHKVQSSGIPLPETPRATILEAAFGKDGLRVIGDASDTVSTFVKQSLSDFRSTDRPALVTIGQNAQQINEQLRNHRLLKENQRKRVARALAEAEAGNRPLYMPLGDFVLIAMPAQPAKGSARNLKWYHALGHEMGHMVFDDYAEAAHRDRATRYQLHTAYEAETGLDPAQEPELYKEWFANKAANEMLNQAMERGAEQGAQQQVTPFTRLAQLMKGLWERIQYLIPEMTRSRSFAQFAKAIREGQVKRDRGQATDDFSIEFYGGREGMQAARLKTGAQALREGVRKANAKGGGMEAVARVYRTTVGRLEGYNRELAGRLFQRSASDRVSKDGPAAWQQMTNAMRDRYTGQMQRVLREIEAGAKGRKGKQSAVEQVFRELERNPDNPSPEARKLGKLIDGIIIDAEQNGLVSVIHPDDFVPVAMNHAAIDKDRAAFAALLREAFPDESEVDINRRIEVLMDTDGFSEYAIAPGVPVSTHDTTRKLLDRVGSRRLREAGFLNERSDAVLYHWIEGLAKRTAWEANFGDYSRDVQNPKAENERLLGRADPQGRKVREMRLVNDEGLYFDPNGRYKKLVAQAVADHGPQAEADINDMLDGVMGRKTSRMPRGIRNVNDWVTAWTSWTVLMFSGIASFPETLLPAVRAHGRVSILDGLKGFPDAWRLAKDMGVVMSDAGERIIWQSMGDSYESSTLNKMSTAFFKYNGTKLVTDINRAMGVSFGTRYLLRSAELGDNQALEQLGVTADDVRRWDQAGRPNWQPGINTSANLTAEKVQAAINQFVYEGSSMPSKFQNPGWFNNPYLKVFWMIKRYMYAYGEGILMGMWRQGKRQWMRGAGLGAEQRAFLAAAPALMFAVATVPLAAAGTELRELMRPWTTGRPGKDVEDHGGALPYAQYLFSRSGGFGPLEALLSMRQQSEWGYSPIGSVSPVAAKAEMLFDWGADGELSGGEALNKVRQLLPVANQTPRFWNEAVSAITD